MLLDGFCNTFTMLTTLKFSDLGENIKDIIKIKLAKFVETLKVLGQHNCHWSFKIS